MDPMGKMLLGPVYSAPKTFLCCYTSDCVPGNSSNMSKPAVFSDTPLIAVRKCMVKSVNVCT